MCKILLLILLVTFEFISNSFGQEVIQIRSNKNFINGPKLYLSRENPMYSQNKTKIKSGEVENDDSDVYTKKILGLNTNHNRFISRAPDADIIPIDRPMHIRKDSPFYNYLTNIGNVFNNPGNSNYNEEMISNVPDNKFVPKKNDPIVSEHGMFSRGSYNIHNNDNKKKKDLNFPEISSYRVKKIKVDNDQPIVQRISTIKFNGETVTPEFLRNYFSQKFKITDDEFETFDSRFNNKDEQINIDGYGLIDVRSNFDTEPKVSKLSVPRNRGVHH